MTTNVGILSDLQDADTELIRAVAGVRRFEHGSHAKATTPRLTPFFRRRSMDFERIVNAISYWIAYLSLDNERKCHFYRSTERALSLLQIPPQAMFRPIGSARPYSRIWCIF